MAMQCTSEACELIGFVRKLFQIYKATCNEISDDPDEQKICSDVERHQSVFDSTDKTVTKAAAETCHPKLKRDYLCDDTILYACEQCDRCYFSPERPQLPGNKNKESAK